MTRQNLFSGLTAFLLTPVNELMVDAAAFGRLIERLAGAGVDSIGALGSTGSYAYLTRAERAHVARLAVEHSGDTPVMIGIGGLRTRDVLAYAEDAQAAGAKAVLLAPVSYQKLTHDEVYGLFETVCRSLSVPLCVYDNPGTTHFDFSEDLHGRIAHLPQVGSIKIPGVPADPVDAKARIARLRAVVPPHVTIGVSGDWFAATGLNAGCDGWYSVIGGLFPKTALVITRAAQAGDAGEVDRLSSRLELVWALFRRHGSLRVVAAVAEHLGLITGPGLPLPLKPLDDAARRQAIEAFEQCGLTADSC